MKPEPISLPELYDLLKELCRDRGLTMQEVLGYAGIPVQYPSKWKKKGARARPPYYYELAKMAEKLNVSVELLTYGSTSQGNPRVVTLSRPDYERLLEMASDNIDKLKEV